MGDIGECVAEGCCEREAEVVVRGGCASGGGWGMVVVAEVGWGGEVGEGGRGG